MSETQKRQLQEVLTLHDEIAGVSRLEKAIRIGKLLTELKKGFYWKFMPWVETNLPFSRGTATKYMRLYREKDRLKEESVSNLAEAYRLLKQKVKYGLGGKAPNLTLSRVEKCDCGGYGSLYLGRNQL